MAGDPFGNDRVDQRRRFVLRAVAGVELDHRPLDAGVRGELSSPFDLLPRIVPAPDDFHGDRTFLEELFGQRAPGGVRWYERERERTSENE